MKQLPILLIIFALLSCKQKIGYQKTPIIAHPIFFTENTTYTQNFRELLHDFYLYKGDKKKNIVLIDESVKFENVGKFLEDSTSFTPFETNYIIDETDYLSRIKFKNNLGKNVVIIPKDTLNAFFNHGNDWPGFHKKYGSSFIHLAHPIFLRENTYCILYLNYGCGGLCGEEQIRLYKKISNKWIWLKTGHGWIN